MSFEETPDTGLRLDEIMSGAWSQAELVDALQEIADGVYGVVGFGVAAISVLRDNDELESSPSPATRTLARSSSASAAR